MTAYLRYFPICSDSLFVMRLALSLLCLFAFAGLMFAQNPKTVVDRVAAQNALFEEQYESDLKNFPERATAFGDYRYNDNSLSLLKNEMALAHVNDRAASWIFNGAA